MKKEEGYLNVVGSRVLSWSTGEGQRLAHHWLTKDNIRPAASGIMMSYAGSDNDFMRYLAIFPFDR